MATVIEAVTEHHRHAGPAIGVALVLRLLAPRAPRGFVPDHARSNELTVQVQVQ